MIPTTTPTKAKMALAVGAMALALAASACTAAPQASPTTTGGSASGTAKATLTVFAAASMQSTFTELQQRFQAAHPGTTITFNFAGSQALATQLVEGASADVFVSANEAQMKVVTDAGLNAAAPTVFATNELTIAVPPDNPAGIRSLQDLTKKGLKLVVCAPAVPCGAATQKLESATGLSFSPVSEEQAVTGVLAKVRSGEAVAGLVYKTDVIAAGDAVKGIDFPEASKAVNSNPIVLLKAAPNASAGQAWIDLVLSAEGQKVFTNAGFGPAKS